MWLLDRSIALSESEHFDYAFLSCELLANAVGMERLIGLREGRFFHRHRFAKWTSPAGLYWSGSMEVDTKSPAHLGLGLILSWHSWQFENLRIFLNCFIFYY